MDYGDCSEIKSCATKTFICCNTTDGTLIKHQCVDPSLTKVPEDPIFIVPNSGYTISCTHYQLHALFGIKTIPVNHAIGAQ